MNRLRLGLLAAALALPILVLGGMVAEAERDLGAAQVFSVPIRGADPRDLLRGHYVLFDYDWAWTERPSYPRNTQSATLCLTAPREDSRGPQAGFATEGCVATIDGMYMPGTLRTPPGFRPAAKDRYGPPRLYIPEEYASRLDALLRSNSAVVTIDLAVTADRRALIRGWRVDGKQPRDYFR